MIAMLFMAFLFWLMFMLLAATTPSVTASWVFLVSGLFILLFTQILYYAMGVVIGPGVSFGIIVVSSLVHICWSVWIVAGQKKRAVNRWKSSGTR